MEGARNRSGTIRRIHTEKTPKQDEGPTTFQVKRASAARTSEVVHLPNSIAQQVCDEWLAWTGRLREFETVYDTTDRVLWCYMKPVRFTLAFLEECRALQDSLRQLFAEWPRDEAPPLRYVVWASSVPGIYNLGGDLPTFMELIHRRDREGLARYAGLCVDIVYENAITFDLPLVTISLVQGNALGGGFESAISANVVVAEKGAKFGLPEILFNLFPGMGAYSFIARRIGPVAAERMIMSGRVYEAEELHEMGLVDVLAEEGTGEGAVYDYIDRNDRRHNAHCALYRVRQRFNPVTHEELKDIAEIWVDAALSLGEADLRKMERLVAAQSRFGGGRTADR